MSEEQTAAGHIDFLIDREDQERMGICDYSLDAKRPLQLKVLRLCGEYNDLHKTCASYKRRYEKAEEANKKLRAFLDEWDGHGVECELYDEGSPWTGYCNCGYEEAKEKALKGGEDALD